MATYRVQFFDGDYYPRQEKANQAGVICYVEHHFNSNDTQPDTNYSMAIVGTNASDTSKAWGEAYTQLVSERFHIDDNGLQIGGTGSGNVEKTHMPAILLEPFLVSMEDGATWAEKRQDDLAAILAQTIKTQFPAGGTVGFSIGHRGRTSHPADHGCTSKHGKLEDDLASAVLLKAKALLEA